MGKLTDITDLMVSGKEDFNYDFSDGNLIINDYFKVTEDTGQFYVSRVYNDKPEWKCKDAKSVVSVIEMNMPDASGNRILNEIISSAEEKLNDDLATAASIFSYEDDYYPAFETLYDAFIKIKALAKELGE